MASGARYRLAGVFGTIGLVSLAFFVANHAAVQTAVTALVPVLSRLGPHVLTGEDAVVALALTVGAFLVALTPLFKPRPRRILDILALAGRRSVAAVLALATLGYFDYTYRLPRPTLIVLGAALVVALPAWFVLIRRRPDRGPERAIVVGDDAAEIRAVVDAAAVPLIGFVSPPSAYRSVSDADAARATADGGATIGGQYLGGLPSLGDLKDLGDVLVDHDVDTVVFAFSEPTRSEFFTALADCHDHGVDAKVHRNHTDSVLTAPGAEGDLVDVELEPWDWQERVLKRAFDVWFAVTGLLCALPVMVAVAIAIKVDSPGPVLYSQERTTEFGATFTVYKFRSMVENAEDGTGAVISNEDEGGVDPRVTRVGRVLRQTHLDEIPQLWSILVGDMSVVGPRPERPELDTDIRGDVAQWQKRWFVKPGLTGLAQINGVTGTDPDAKLRYDVEYIRNQNLPYDVKIVVRQIWQVVEDITVRE